MPPRKNTGRAPKTTEEMRRLQVYIPDTSYTAMEKKATKSGDSLSLWARKILEKEAFQK